MKHVLLTAVFFCSISLIGCGGSGGGGGDSGGNSDGNDPVPTTSAEGLWNGTSSNNREITGLVLDDGTYWFIYSAQGNSAVIAGFIEGNGTSQNGSFTSSNGREFNLEGLSASDLTVNATYVMKQSFEGTAKYKTSGETVTIRGSYNTGYDNTPLLATVAGNYTGSTATSAGTEYATIFVSSEG